VGIQTYKEMRTTVILLFILLSSCGKINKESVGGNIEKEDPCREDRIELENLRTHAIGLEHEHENLLLVLNQIQESLNDINTDNIFVIPTNTEMAYKNYLTSLGFKAEQVRLKITEQQEEIDRLKNISRGSKGNLNRLIENYKVQLENKNKAIEELNNITAIQLQKIKKMDTVIEKQRKRINDLDDALTNQLNQTYLMLFSSKDAHIEKVKSNRISIPYPRKKVKMLTEHPMGSFSLVEGNERLFITILDREKFWEDSKYLIFQIEARKLKIP
jgi:chromosome segregation ATPase